jgi:hypothetical protein
MAARIMKQQDVGPVPVVADHSDMRLLGILTDRDIALNVVAEGRDAYSTRVDSIMSTDPVTCAENEDASEAVKRMADYQIRRIPVVDENKRLVGIISQADIARSGHDDQVGDMVEEISQPSGSGSWSGTQFEGDMGRRSSALDSRSALAIGAICIGFGAGLMFLFDPSRGRKRRAHLAERGTEMWNQRAEMLQRTKGAISEGAQNLVSATRAKLSRNPDESSVEHYTPEPAGGSVTR